MEKVKRVAVILVVLAVLAGLFFVIRYLWPFIKTQDLAQLNENLAELDRGSISTPGPLEARQESDRAYLTKAGVIKWTNQQRKDNSLQPLKEDSRLDGSAMLKVEDMFNHQYFAHQSLTGEGVDDLAKRVGYQFLAIGENLARGNFKDDQALVEEWMASPGHRANILNSGYREIGVAVIKGLYKGEETWVIVQHFGTPGSACTQPSQSLKTRIESNNQKLEQLMAALEQLQAEIKASPGAGRDQKIKEYNQKVNQYNVLIEETRALTNQYNDQVTEYNRCLKNPP